MGFAGELTTIGLPEVFQNVAFNRLTGVMTVSERGRQAALFFENGMIRALRPEEGREFDYVAIAHRFHAAPADALREAARRRRRRTLKELLAGEAGFDEARFDEAVEAAIREGLILLFSWRQASFVFEEVRPARGTFDREQLACNLMIDPRAVAMEAARRVDEWETIASEIRSERDIFLAARELEDVNEVSPAMRRLVERLDGTRDLRQIIDDMPEGRFHVLRMVAELAARGIVARATPEQLRELGESAEERGEIHVAIAHLEAALEMDRSNEETRRELMRLYERAGRRTESAREHKRLARAQEQKGDLDGALESYGRAAELTPYDTDALERLMSIHDARGDKEEFMRAGLRLAEALSSQRLLEEALEVYQRLLVQDADSLLLREALASTYVKLHEPLKAGRVLLQLAQQSWERKEYDRALHYYRNVLAVDRDCAEAAARIVEIERGQSRQRRRAVRRRIVVSVVTILLSLVVWQGVREWFAYRALHDAARKSLSGLVRAPKDASLIDAVEQYALVNREFPHTTAAPQAEDMVHALLADLATRLRDQAAEDPGAADRALQRLARIRLPAGVKPFWSEARDEILERISAGSK